MEKIIITVMNVMHLAILPVAGALTYTSVSGEILMNSFSISGKLYAGSEHSSSNFIRSTYEVSRVISAALYELGASVHAVDMPRSAATIFSASVSCCSPTSLVFTLSSSMYMALAIFGLFESHRKCRSLANDHGKSCKFSITRTLFSLSGSINYNKYIYIHTETHANNHP